MADKKTPYEVLGVAQESTEKEITKAYRKKALICHPDKNPDNPKAVALFHELSKALEVLTDPKARASLDANLKAKERQRLRNQALDAKRKKFKLDLEQQENLAKVTKESTEETEKRLKAEIERLREEGSQLLKEQQDLMRTQMQDKQQTPYIHIYDHTPKLKVKWKCKKNDERKGGYTEEILNTIFKKYGEVSHIILSTKKKGNAIVEFANVTSAKLALMNEFGNTDNPLNISWLEDPVITTEQTTAEAFASPVSSTPTSTSTTPSTISDTISDKDYESVTLMRLRQAQERKRLIEEMQKEDEEG
ncbi:dnaJ homolog subfamily C member 17-like [Actinia tenebrosa]|uniref:DnaJ homolog subfamily C member 17-like n=1 Tax=Actinia tenebrosa TaxID=6105 RepID=A0A6P8HX26_ACTTE|nr:dnaJ homolog subfamily C member 17-like [Actinia tenebrosa]